jgi:two-component system, cell cycle sensor histidine kinase and response regulator CckA
MLSTRVLGDGRSGWRRLEITLLLAGLLWGRVSRGQAAAMPTPGEVLTSVQQLWALTGDARKQPHHVRVDLVVCYYDPYWRLLWTSGDAGISFVFCREKQYPLHEGQLIRIDGLMDPAIGLSLDHAEVTVLNENAPATPRPWNFEGSASEAASLSQLVTVDGFVNRESEVDPNHILLEMTVGKWPVQARVLLHAGDRLPQWGSAFVRARGVLVPNQTPAGQLSNLALWIARPEDVTVTGWLGTDPRFRRERTLIDTLPHLPGDKLVRLVGTVRNQEAGHSLTVRDNTGQVTILTGQTEPIPTGQPVEAIGFPSIEGERWTLRDGLFRPLVAEGPGAKAPPAEPSVLRLAEQVLELGNEQAAKSVPVRLFGVVTWADAEARYFYLNDESGGVRVNLSSGPGAVPVQGNTVEIQGRSAAGDFAPEVRATRVTVTGSLSIPEAKDVTLEQAMTGVEEGQWVEIQGFVRKIERAEPWAKLYLTTPGGAFTAYLPPSGELSRLEGSVVRLSGVCTAIADPRRQLTGIRLLVPSAASDYVQVDQPAPADPFAATERTIASLHRFSTLQSLNRRVRISGVVLLQKPGRYLYVQDGTDSIQVLSRETAALAPGDRVDVVGFPGREGSRLVLREAVFRRRQGGREPVPLAVKTQETVNEDLDGHLVRITGLLLDSTLREQDRHLVIQSGPAVFEATLDRGLAAGAGGSWVPGSRLALTGVYQVQVDEYHRPRGFQVQLRSAADVQVLARPSWWTPRRAWAAVGALALCVALGVGWVLTLRRRVGQQTAQIREQLGKEARLEEELRRSQKLESLGVLAGGIAHDFNNLLTVIMGNLTLARLDSGGLPTVSKWLREAEKGVLRARDLTLQLLTFAKGGDPVRKAHRLAGIVREAAEFVLHGAKVRCEFDLAADLWPADVDKGQISRVIQNIVINAIQAMPEGGVIRITLGNATVEDGAAPDLAPGKYLLLTIGDTGVGISAEHLPRIFDPYFTTKPGGTGLGLATVYSIVKRHAGRVEVQSKLGTGTTFRIWLPAAAEVPAAEAPAPPEATVPAPSSGRVLLMDDEDAIRRTAEALLKRIGIEVTVTGDGREALLAYSAARTAARPFDLVILDLTVPGGMGGRETLENLRQMDPGVRALVSSGYSSDPVLAHYRAHGFLGMVAKPYDLTELTAAIHAALQPKAG